MVRAAQNAAARPLRASDPCEKKQGVQTSRGPSGRKAEVPFLPQGIGLRLGPGLCSLDRWAGFPQALSYS